MLFFDPSITLDLRNLLPWAGELFKLITELGSETFYIGLVFIGFWTFHKRESIITAFILLFTLTLNFIVKLAIANPRPDPATYLYPGLEEPANYSTPSGHAQNSATLFGWFSIKLKTWWMLLISIVLTTLIGISRVYLGVHYLGDVLIGWGIGVASVLILYYLQKPLTEMFSRIKENYLYLGLLLFGFIGIVIFTYIAPQPPGDNFGALGGVIMGLAIGLPLEKRYVSFSVEPTGGQKWKLVLRAIIGILLVIGSLMVLSLFMTAEVWLRALRYMIVGIIGVFIWPFAFTKLKL
ncbi:MAG: phosphatase PAP2 family protein [Candidatus Thorarchaeota archaeon]